MGLEGVKGRLEPTFFSNKQQKNWSYTYFHLRSYFAHWVLRIAQKLVLYQIYYS